MGMAYMGAWSFLSPQYNYDALALPLGAAGSAKQLGPLGRIGYVQMAGLAARTKYYGIWTLTNVSKWRDFLCYFDCC
jgi:lysophospholipid acyltransferase